MTQVKLSVNGMACQGCADSLGRLFSEEPGISVASVSYEDEAATIDFDPNRVSEARLAEIVEAAGFTVAG